MGLRPGSEGVKTRSQEDPSSNSGTRWRSFQEVTKQICVERRRGTTCSLSSDSRKDPQQPVLEASNPQTEQGGTLQNPKAYTLRPWRKNTGKNLLSVRRFLFYPPLGGHTPMPHLSWAFSVHSSFRKPQAPEASKDSHLRNTVLWVYQKPIFSSWLSTSFSSPLLRAFGIQVGAATEAHPTRMLAVKLDCPGNPLGSPPKYRLHPHSAFTGPGCPVRPERF